MTAPAASRAPSSSAAGSWARETTANQQPHEPYEQPYAPYELEGSGVAGVKAALDRDRAARMERIGGWLDAVPRGPLTWAEEERYLDLRLSTVTGDHLAGQVVTDDSRLVYASLFAPV